MADADADSASSSSSDSDDDFLTLSNNNKNASSLDREALVRKKLLESFYGKSAVAAAGPGSMDLSDDGLFDDDDEHDGKPSSAVDGDKDDLDSPAFDADAHTRNHVLGSSVHTLLETEEKLSLQVRTLDSTMQTLVYENYSRFIDATDAIRSIGVNVQANEDGLGRLTKGMLAIDEQSRTVEEALGTLRDQVAEKIRVKRLLTRLDALLKLPKTLREQIEAGKYHTATKSYLSASSILSKHSKGFESLKTIETECNTILDQMKEDLKRKILHWSGRLTASLSFDDSDDGMPASTPSGHVSSSVPDSPKNISAIFECAGTLFILLGEENSNDLIDDGNYDAGLISADELRSLSTAASMRLLDRLLDAHMIEVQERRFAGPGGLDSGKNSNIMDLSTNKLGSSLSNIQQQLPPETNKGGAGLIPCDVLDGILEAATLYRMNFGTDGVAGRELLEFLSETYSTFLMHVRATLLEESMRQTANTGAAAVSGEEGQEEVDTGEKEVSAALSILLSSVRELASGLALPEVGISVDFASGLVDQVLELTESMVRRRVDQKFIRLRESVVQTCLVPFVDRAISERREAISSGNPALRAIVQIGSSTLSDCLQLVDDTIRSTFSGGISSRDPATSLDLPILKEAVQVSTNRFAAWLASAFEILAGGESSDPMRVVEAPMHSAEGGHEEEKDGYGFDSEDRAGNTVVSDDQGDYAAENSAVLALIDRAHNDLLSVDSDMADMIDSDFILGIAEMCRLAQGSVSDNLDQSIATHLGGGKKKQPRGLFPSGDHSPGKNQHDEAADETTKRFQMAFSRLIVLFATTRGSDMGERLSRDFQEDLYDVSKPRSVIWDALEFVKHTSIECTGLYGGNKRAGPIPAMEVDSVTSLSSALRSRNKTGLQLDVERMFKESVTIYPHPSEILEASRNSILFVVMKVAFRTLLESIRMSTLSAASFRQLQVDTEFLKLMVPHYISSDFLDHGNNVCTTLSNLLEDVMSNAEERCLDAVDREDFRYEAKEIVRRFMAGIESADFADKFIIQED